MALHSFPGSLLKGEGKKRGLLGGEKRFEQDDAVEGQPVHQVIHLPPRATTPSPCTDSVSPALLPLLSLSG